MRRFIGLFPLLLILLFAISCIKKNSVKIEVNTTSASSNKLVIEKLSFTKSVIVDSANLSKGNDRITFRIKEILEPTFIVINIKSKGAITLLVEPEEKIKVEINSDDMLGYQVLGSKGSLLTKDLTVQLAKTRSSLEKLRKEYLASTDENIRARFENQFDAVIDSQRAFSSRFIWANAMSRASVMALYQKFDDENYVFDRSDDIILFKAVASSLKALYPNSDYTKGILADINRLQNILSNIKISNLINQVESSIPEIELPNINGDTVKLSSYKGKVILLDFWASWNQSSLLDNRELLEIYSQYRSKGFAVYQVSLDYNRDEWVNAIESAGLPWTNVSSLNPNGNIAAMTYNVTKIPANYLIGKDFSIVGKNLYGEALKSKLKELLN